VALGKARQRDLIDVHMAGEIVERVPYKRRLSLVREKDFRDLIHPWIERRYFQRLSSAGAGPGF
jgi:hypothetical protein